MARKKVGLLACSFALEEGNEPNKCNRRLGKSAIRLTDWARFGRGRIHHKFAVFARKWIVGGRPGPNLRRYDDVVVVSQWEVAKALPKNFEVAKVVDQFEILPETVTDSEELVAQAAAEFKKHGIEDVIVVAHGLQRPKVKGFLRKAGFRPIWAPVGWVGFDWTSDQWWTRDPIRIVIYIGLQIVTRFKYGGPTYKSGKKEFARSLQPKRAT